MKTFQLTVKIVPIGEEIDCEIPEGTSAGELVAEIVQQLGLQEPADRFCLTIGDREYLANDILPDGTREALFSYKKQKTPIGPITVTLRVMPKGDEVDIEVADPTSTFGELKKMLFEQGVAPASAPDGIPYAYEFISKNTNLRHKDEESVLSTAEDGEIILFVPKLVAGYSPQPGIFLYQVPDKMVQRHPHRCVFRIANEELREYIEKDLKKQDIETEAIRLGKVMKVTLLENTVRPMLHILPLSEAEQFLVDDDYTEWLFDVTPTYWGLTSLILRASIVETIDDGREKSRDVLVLNKEIIVETSARLNDDSSSDDFESISGDDWEELSQWRFFKKERLIAVIAKNETGRALAELSNFLQKNDPEMHKSIILLQAQWNGCKNMFDLNLIDFATWHLHQSKINYTLIDIVQQIDTRMKNSGKMASHHYAHYSKVVGDLHNELGSMQPKTPGV